jgi:hypothetical protein
MLAHCLTTIVPRMPLASAIDTARIHLASALTGARKAVVTTQPCRARPQWDRFMKLQMVTAVNTRVNEALRQSDLTLA